MQFVLALLIILLCPSVYAEDSQTYLGFDAGVQQLKFQPNYGANFFAQQQPSYQLFVGVKHPNHFGFEIGFNTTATDKKKIVQLNAGDFYPGSNVAMGPGEWQKWRNNIDIKAAYFGFNRFIAINHSKTVNLFGFLGISITHLQAKTDYLDDDLTGAPSQATINMMQQTFEATRLTPMVKLGVDYKISSKFNCRAVYEWQNYSSFKNIRSEKYPNSFTIKPKYSQAIYLGIYYSW